MIRRLFAVLVVVALLPVAAIGRPAAAAAVPECPASAPTKTDAMAAAEACGGSVEIESERTETGRVFANPDGSATVEEYAHPQRVRRADGSWADLDATLVRNPDGSFSPRATIVDVTLPSGGSGPLVTGRRGGQSVALRWPGELPPPRVEGAVATYPDVLPGVDLVVTVYETGFGQVLVVKDRTAAANPQLRRIVMDTELQGLRWRDDQGRLEAVDNDGNAVLAATGPRMWDSSPATVIDASGRIRGDVSGPAEGARTEPIDLAVTEGQLVLEPATNMLDDPKVQFPLFIDPSIAYNAWTMINSDYKNQSYWSYDKTDCPYPFSGECAKVGHVWGYATMIYRSMWRFPTSAFQGKLVTSAKFTIDLLYSGSSSNTKTELREVSGNISSSTNWNNNASLWGSSVASVSNSSYPAARKLSEFSSSTLRSRIQEIANGSATYTVWGLRAADESTHNAWKKFDAKTAKLIIGINDKPNKPSSLTVDAKSCVTGGNRPVISTATPVLKAKVTDPNGDSMDATFTWAKWDG